MNIRIQQNTPMPIYEQIVNQVKNNIVAKTLISGEMLPSIRTLAKNLQISVITTKRAYEELEKEGLITSKRGKGFYVCENNTNILREKQTVLLENRFTPLVNEAKKNGIKLEDLIDMIKILYENN